MGKQQNRTRRQDTDGEMCILVIINCYTVTHDCVAAAECFVWQTLLMQELIGQARFTYSSPHIWNHWSDNPIVHTCCSHSAWMNSYCFGHTMSRTIIVHWLKSLRVLGHILWSELSSFILLQSLCVTEFMLLSASIIGQMLIKFIMVHICWKSLSVTGFMPLSVTCDVTVHTHWSHAMCLVTI